jgi:hypothetical protein
MNIIKRAFLLIIVIASGCANEPEIIPESWVSKPLKDWPNFALTNEICINDTTFKDLANSFIVNTGKDTIGVTCKHIFMVFRNKFGFNSIDLGDDFDYWEMYPKNKTDERIRIKTLINEDSNEGIGPFREMKARDWIIFDFNKKTSDLYPLKIRYTPVKPNEIVYSVGWGSLQEDNSQPALIKFKCYKNSGDYYYVQRMKTNRKPNARSGSAIIDKNGYLVGILSGAEGNLGVFGSTKYLISLFEKYGVEYEMPSR